LINKTGNWVRAGSAFQHGPVGIHEVNSSDIVTVYPNPFEDVIHLNLKNLEAK
jgi:hypothetical protein